MNYAPSMYVLCEIQLNDGLMQPLKFPSAKKRFTNCNIYARYMIYNIYDDTFEISGLVASK